MDWWNETAKRVYGAPEGWRWCSLDGHNAPKGFVMVEGAVPVGEFRSGARKGRTKWPPKSKLDTIWIHDNELAETKRLWSEQTGKCAECVGSGQRLHSVSVRDGTVYKPCKYFNGTGLLQNEGQ
jgi:hypothetical protein